jgi:hypothetical protein
VTDDQLGSGPFQGEQFPGGQFPGQFPSEQVTTGGQVPTGGQATDPCPQCGSTANVHSIGELAAIAQMQLDKLGAGGPQQGAGQQGWNAEPRSGPVPGWAGEPQAGPPPGTGGWAGGGGWAGRTRDYYDDSPVDAVDQAIANVALGAAARFIGRAVAKRVQQTVNDRVMPVLAQRQDLLRQQIAIAQQHPDIRACMTDHVIFLAGGSRTLPMPNLGTITTQQADTLVAQLSQG